MTKQSPKKCFRARTPSPRQTFRVNVEYDGGIDPELDSRLKKLVGRESDGSGFFFLTRTRDIGWVYKQRSTAEAALKRIKAARIRRVKAELLEQDA